MAQIDFSILGTIFVILGLSAALLTLVLLRRVQRTQPGTSSTAPVLPQFDEPDQTEEGVLIVQAGGRVAYLNSRAREYLDAWDELPSIEDLSRKFRPSDAFLEICSIAGDHRLHLNGHTVQIRTYSIPYGENKANLLAFQPVQPLLELKNGHAGQEENSHNARSAVSLLNELGQAMAASLDIETTIKAILEKIQTLLAYDSAEVTLYDPDRLQLTVYRLASMTETRGGALEVHINEPGSRAFSEQLLEKRNPVIMLDSIGVTAGVSNPDPNALPAQSFIGVPLVNAGELIGTLELRSLSQEAYSQNDLEILQILSGPASSALKNALLYREEQLRGKELAGLADLAKAVGTGRDVKNLFLHLIESIAPLIDVNFLGFILYDEFRHTLEGQHPFMGLHADVIEWATTVIKPGTPAEELWLSGETIISHQAASDPKLQAFGFDNLAVAAGITQMVLMPLTSSGKSLGYILVGDKLDKTPFDPDDIRLLEIISGQTGPIVENAELIHQSDRRAQRAETLRRIASLTGSSATMDEVLKYSLQDLGRLLNADKVGVLLFDQERGELRLHKPSLFGISPEFASRMGEISSEDPEFSQSVARSQNYLFSDDIQDDLRLPRLYHPLLLSLGLKSAIIAPLVVRDRGIGELLMGSYQPHFFAHSDVQTVITACGQLASLIESAALYTQTDESLRQRVDQLTSLTRLSRELNTNLDLDKILQQVYDEVRQTTHADCGNIVLFDNDGDDLTVPESDDQPMPWPGILLQIGDPLPESMHSLELRVLQSGEALICDDYKPETADLTGDEEASRPPPHRDIRASLIVPIAYQGNTAGLIHLHSKTPRLFDQTAMDICEALALQAAVALGNAYRYQERVQQSEQLNRRVESLAKLLNTSLNDGSIEALENSLSKIAVTIQESTLFDRVSLYYYDPDREELISSAGVEGSRGSAPEEGRAPVSWASYSDLILPEYALGKATFVPVEKSPTAPHKGADKAASGYVWQPGDLLFIPMTDHDEQPLGIITLQEPRDHLRPDLQTLESLDIFVQQASYVITSHRNIHGLKSRAEHIQEDLVRAEQAVLTAHSHLPILMHKDLEQTIAVQQLSQRAARIRSGMDISEIVSRQGDRSSVLMVFGREILTRMDMDIALIVEPGNLGPHLLHSLGRVPGNIQIDALIGQRNPLLHTLQSGEQILVSRLETDSDWSASPLLHTLEAKSFICIPIFIGARLDSAILAISQKPLAPFSAEDEQLFSLLARNVAITLQNLNLLLEISRHLAEVNLLLDFNRQLSNLEPERILQTLVESALHVLPLAQASLVVIWDPKKELLIPQAAAGYVVQEKIMQIHYQPGEALPGKAFAKNQPIRVEEVNFPSLYNLTSDMLLNYHDATDGLLPVSSMAVPLQKAPGTDPLGVLVVENFKVPEAFSIDAQALVTSLTQQTALNLEYSRLFRAAELRANQLQALTGAAAIISSNLQPEELVGSLLDQLEAILPFNTGTLWLRQADQMFVHGTRGFADSDVRTGLSISIEDSLLLREMIDTCQAIYVGDVRNDPRFPSLVENPNPSWLGLPLVAGGEVIGVIALEKDEEDFYSAEHIQIAIAFAGQAAVALENANLYQQIVSRAADLDQRSQRLEMLNRFSTQLSGSLDPDHLLSIILQELIETLNCTAVSAVMFDTSGKAVLKAELPPRDVTIPRTIPDAPIFERLRQTLGVFYCEDVSSEEELAPLKEYLDEIGTQSLLALSLATGSDLHGILLVHSEQPYHYTGDEVGLAKTISNQAAIAIQNGRLYAETSSLTNELDQRVRERTEQLARAHQRTETLLRLITELSASLDLEQVLTRTLKVLNQIIDAEHITVLLARTGEKKLHHLASVGYQTALTTDEFFTSLDPDEGLAGWIIQQRKPVLIPDVRDDPRWVQLPNSTVEYRSAIGVPLLIGGVSLGTLLFFHRRVDHFSMDQLDMVQAAANQVAIAVNNAELYRLIRDQAEDLGNMVRSQQIETQRTKAMLEDVADGVLVTDETMRITLFNDSAEDILGLNRSNVIGKSLEHFIGIFGKAAKAWMGTIRTWSQNPDTFTHGDTYAEQIDLDNGRVVSVHLAPVSLRDNFLGTVSIFRDITHQVEVDRLKSEFVATVSHELRTPMTSIKGYVDILLMGAAGPLTNQQAHFLEIVKNNSERLAILVNDLLDISRIESGRLNLSIQHFDLAPLAHETTTDLARRSQEDNKPMQIETDIPRKLPRVLGDPEQVRRIIENLLENAYCYTAEGGRILVRTRRAGDDVQIDIQDTGIGIPLDLQPRVFERFYRGEHPFVLATSGTGLGLSIVKHLVDMHDGKIWLESSGVPGEGSTFSFTLPVYNPEK